MLKSHSVEELNSTRRKFNITVEAAATKAAFHDAVSEVQKTAEVRGFRKESCPLI